MPPRERVRDPCGSGDAAASSFQRAEIDAVGVDDEPLAVRDADDGDVESLATADSAAAARAAAARAPPTLPTPMIASASRLLRLEERLVDGVERAHLLRRVDDARDVALRRALRDRADVDVLPAERVEHLAGDARPALHPLADDRENRLVAA